jgi:hypothetical protein
LNQVVEWDGTTNSVYIGNKPNGKLTSLTSLDYARTNSDYFIRIDKWRNSPFTLAGKTYSTGVGFSSGPGGGEGYYVVYNLNSQYKNLTALFGIDDQNKGAGNNGDTVIIYGDDKEIYRSPKTLAGNTTKIDVSLQGVNQLKIVFNGDVYTPILVNPQLQ